MKLNEVAKEIGLKITEEKTKIMIQTRKKAPIRQSVTINLCNFELVDNFLLRHSSYKTYNFHSAFLAMWPRDVDNVPSRGAKKINSFKHWVVSQKLDKRVPRHLQKARWRKATTRKTSKKMRGLCKQRKLHTGRFSNFEDEVTGPRRMQTKTSRG